MSHRYPTLWAIFFAATVLLGGCETPEEPQSSADRESSQKALESGIALGEPQAGQAAETVQPSSRRTASTKPGGHSAAPAQTSDSVAASANWQGLDPVQHAALRPSSNQALSGLPGLPDKPLPAPAVCGDGVIAGSEQCESVGGVFGQCCDPATCKYKLNGVACDLDGDLCTQDTCQTGLCSAGLAKTCNDNNACTDDNCNATTGDCQFTNDNYNVCSDNNACTNTDFCQAGVCVGSNATQCNDNKACTDDACNPVTGTCTYTNDDTNVCSDLNACTEGDHCLAGTCMGGAPKVCNDNNACTDDSCNIATGNCIYTNDNNNPCSDGNPCTLSDVCVAGTCVGNNLKVCDDGNACTDDTCDPVTAACIFLNDDTNSCSDGDKCTKLDICQSGACVR